VSSGNPLLWFRNDLRTNDNPALQTFLQQQDANKVGKAVFFISQDQWLQHHWSPIKIDFIKRHALALVTELKALNIELSLIEVPYFSDQISYLKQYCSEHSVTQVIANSELEINELKRDQTCIAQQIPLQLFEADVIVPKGTIRTQTGGMYKVFTPFKRAWLQYVREFGFTYLGDAQQNSIVSTPENTLYVEISPTGPSHKWPLVNDLVKQALPLFFKHKITGYESKRDIPSIKGTSGISPYLAAGVLSPRLIFNDVLTQFPAILIETDSPEFSWLNEIIWREFYRHLLFDQPRLCKNQCFNEKYQDATWPFDQHLFTAWCEGKTGYPIVDAAMRQLNQTGWMHNRLRMVVASFLTKHLLIDWRMGERYFMQHLIDGDLAANNGGWQWASSTGCDAQPYFRIFNPIRQSERFDPKGDFIRNYVPELKAVPDKHIHFPHTFIKQQRLSTYWPTIVDHKEARLNALAFYK